MRHLVQYISIALGIGHLLPDWVSVTFIWLLSALVFYLGERGIVLRLLEATTVASRQCCSGRGSVKVCVARALGVLNHTCLLC